MEDITISISGKKTVVPSKVYFVQGDKAANIVTFKVNTKINGVDLTGLDWKIKVVNPNANTFYTDDLPKTEGTTIDLVWTVTENYTGKETCSKPCCNDMCGGLCVSVQGYSGDTIFTSFIVEGFEVLKDCQADQLMNPDYFNDLLAELTQLRNDAVAAAETAQNVELHPVIQGPNGNLWNWQGDPTTGSYVDSGQALSVIENGTNANGSYTKFPDGTLICTKRIETTNYTMTTSAGNSTWRGDLVAVGQYAYAFVGTPSVQKTMYSTTGVTCWQLNYQGACALARDASLSTGFTAVMEVTAIGRWQ